MSIVLLTAPNPTSPGSISDYQYQNAYLTATLQAFTGRVLADGTTIRAGSVIKVGDLLYKATTDTAISGAETPYIKITPAGASASASFVSSLTGVSWSHAHGQYLDVSGNAYFFDEALAVLAAELSSPRTSLGEKPSIDGLIEQLENFGFSRYNESGGYFSSTTNGNFTVPAGVYELWVWLIGGGGGGGGGGNMNSQPGGAGGSGASIFTKVHVTPGQVIAFDVRGGAPGVGFFQDGSDGAGFFGAYVTEAEGHGGKASVNSGSLPGTGGIGGAVATPKGPTVNGQNGGTGTGSQPSGQGGGVAASGNTVSVSGVIPVTAGAGGNGAPWQTGGNASGVAGSNGFLGIVY